MNEAGMQKRVVAYLKKLGYPREAIQEEFRAVGHNRLDLAVTYNGRVVVAVEVKAAIFLPADDKALPFDSVVRRLQFDAIEVNAKFYLLTDGDRFLWFETDKSGRPAKLPSPKQYMELTVDSVTETSQAGQIAIAKGCLRTLLERSRAQRWSPEALPLVLYAYLRSERGDSTFLNLLLKLDEWPSAELNQRQYKKNHGESWFNAIHTFISQQDSTNPPAYEAAVELLVESGLIRLSPVDALQLIDSVILSDPSWLGGARLPRWTSDLLTHLANIGPNDRVLDINCGVGNLPAAIRLASEAPAANMTLFARYATDALWCAIQQLFFDLPAPLIMLGNPLSLIKDETQDNEFFDRILIAPPFGLDLRHTGAIQNNGGYFSSEEAYLLAALDKLARNGRAVVLLPNGALSSPTKAAFREILIANGLRSVIDIGAFLPGSGAFASVAVLDRSDRAIKSLFFADAQNRQRLETFNCRELPGVARILDSFSGWVDSDSLENELDGSFAIAQPRDDGILNAGPYLAGAAQLRLPPTSFEHVPLDRVSEVTRGASIRRSKGSGTVAFIAPGAIRSMEVNLDPSDVADEEEVSQFENTFARPGDIVINGISTYVAAAALIESGEYPINRHVFRVRVDRKRVLPEFLVIAINSRYTRNQLLISATGSIMRALNLTGLRSTLVPIPPLSIQEEIVKRMEIARNERNQAFKLLQLKEASLNSLIENLDAGENV